MANEFQVHGSGTFDGGKVLISGPGDTTILVSGGDFAFAEKLAGLLNGDTPLVRLWALANEANAAAGLRELTFGEMRAARSAKERI